MTTQAQILACLAGQGSGPPLFLPDLTLWHHSRRTRGLPPDLAGLGLPAIARRLGLPIWVTVQPWRLEYRGVEALTVEEGGLRTITYRTGHGTLTSRWTLEDGDWWQTEYPVKGAADLPAARELVAARTYVPAVDTVGSLAAEVGADGVVALELPMRPYADILHTLLGWQEGLLLWAGDGRDLLEDMLGLLEDRLAALVRHVADLPAGVVLAPDNLDAQFISPRVFRQSLLPGYMAMAQALHAAGKRLVVHAGGPLRRLLPLLAEAGVDAVEGVAGPPQGDATLAEARAAAPGLGLWGGISQDYLIPDIHDEQAFVRAACAAAEEARGDGHMLLGIADRVPVDADLTRLANLPGCLRA